MQVPLVRKRMKLAKVPDMVPARECWSAREVVPAKDGADQREEEREAREDALAQERPRAGEEIEEARAELSLAAVPFEQSTGGERSTQTSQPA